MDSRATQSHAHEYNEHHHPHNFGSQQVAHGTEEHNDDHEKKSVLKKVKAKAKKIKDTITKHGHHDHEHGHEYNYEHQHIPDGHDLDEEDDEDEEMVRDPDIHGAPIYDSAAVRNATPGEVKTSGPGVNFGGATVMGEPHHEPRVVVVSPATKVTQSRSTDPARTFVGEGNKAVQPKVNLERPMELEEDPHAPGSRPGAYASANYQTKVTDPTGAGGAEIDITPVQKSFARMAVHNEPNPNPEPKILPTITENQYPSVGSHQQFTPELSTATKTPYPSTLTHNQNIPQLSSEIKTQYRKSHDQFTPHLSTSHHPYHDQNSSELSSVTNTQNPSAGSHDQFTPVLSTEHKPHHPSATSHDQNLPQYSSVTKTQYPSTTTHDQNLPQYSSAVKTQYPSAGSHDQFTPELPTPTEPKPQHTTATSHGQCFPPYSSATQSHYPSSGSHDQYIPELPTEHKPKYPSATSHEQNLPQHSSAVETQYPSSGNHDQFTPEFSNNTTTVDEQPQPRHKSMEKQYNQGNSYGDKISLATAAIADKATTAKNAVVSKLGYGGKAENETTSGENVKPSNQSSYTEKISSATSAIADKATSAKNTVASKLGFGEKNASDSSHEEKKNDENVYSATSASGSPAEYGKRIAVSLTEKLAPVYGKGAGMGSAVKSKVSGSESGVVEQDKGVSMKDYFAEKLRPGEDERALSEVISESLYKKDSDEELVEGEGRDVRKAVSDGVHKRREESDEGREVLRGKVIESEEVKRRLGSWDEEKEKEDGEKGMVDMLKGVVGSWFGNSGENQSPQEGGRDLSGNSGVEVEQVNQGAGERRLQESAN